MPLGTCLYQRWEWKRETEGAVEEKWAGVFLHGSESIPDDSSICVRAPSLQIFQTAVPALKPSELRNTRIAFPIQHLLHTEDCQCCLRLLSKYFTSSCNLTKYQLPP